MPSSSMAGPLPLLCCHQAREPGLQHEERIMPLVAPDAIKGIVIVTGAALASCSAWLIGMLAIMTSPALQAAHAAQPFLLG